MSVMSQCEAMVSDDTSRVVGKRPCRIRATVYSNGHQYCYRHNPEVIQKKDAARDAQWAAHKAALKRADDRDSLRRGAILIASKDMKTLGYLSSVTIALLNAAAETYDVD